MKGPFFVDGFRYGVNGRREDKTDLIVWWHKEVVEIKRVAESFF